MANTHADVSQVIHNHSQMLRKKVVMKTYSKFSGKQNTAESLCVVVSVKC